MRTALPNEDSVVADGAPIALPTAPPPGTRNSVLSTGAAVYIYAGGSDRIIWAQQATPQKTPSGQGLVILAPGSAVELFYSTGDWYVYSQPLTSLTGPLTIYTSGASQAQALVLRSTDTATIDQLLSAFDAFGNPIAALPNAGGFKIFGDHNGAYNGVFSNGISLDGTTYPESIKFASGSHLFMGSGTPAAHSQLVAKVNDAFYQFETQTWFVCTVAGTGAAATWVQTSPPTTWTTYTPTFTSSGTQPSIGNGTLTGSYWRYGKTLAFNIAAVYGTTTSVGTGVYQFGLPFACGYQQIMQAYVYDNVNAGTFGGYAALFSPTTLQVSFSTASGWAAYGAPNFNGSPAEVAISGTIQTL